MDISSDVDILEKLNNYADYFKGRSKVRVITTGKVVFGGNTRHDILTQLRMDLVNYFRGQKTTDIFDRIRIDIRSKGIIYFVPFDKNISSVRVKFTERDNYTTEEVLDVDILI